MSIQQSEKFATREYHTVDHVLGLVTEYLYPLSLRICLDARLLCLFLPVGTVDALLADIMYERVSLDWMLTIIGTYICNM